MATKKELTILNKELVNVLRKVTREDTDNLSETLQFEIENLIIKSEGAI